MNVVALLFTSLSLAFVVISPSVGMQMSRMARITTTGTGEVALTPDWAIMTFDITADDSSAVVAAATSTDATERVLDALANLGYVGDSVVQVSFSVQPKYDWSQGQKLLGYRGQATVRLEVRDLDLLARIIDAALSAGATGVSGLRFRSDTEEEARVEALRQAVALARSDAEVLADAAGGRLGQSLEIKTSPGAFPYYAVAEQARRASFAGQAAPDLTPQDVIVMVVVEMEWEFLNGRM